MFEKSFCASPWFHMRINNAGHYEYCRWADKTNRNLGPSIREISPVDYFQRNMAPLRDQFLQGTMPDGCKECLAMEQQNKVSGREKQLLKIGVDTTRFAKTLKSSPWYPVLDRAITDQLPQDWQIDLGNYCNSACVFCTPSSSSRLAQEWLELGFVDRMPSANWTDDASLIDQFLHTIDQSNHIQYLHFIGGETVITPAFKTILAALIDRGLNKTCTIGFTTNLTVWNDEINALLTQFHSVHLGMSIETFDAVNDYVRWPSKIETVTQNLERWQDLAQTQGWLLQLRITPTIFTIESLTSIYDYAWTRTMSIESCNFLQDPAFMRPSVLPMSYRNTIIDKISEWLNHHKVTGNTLVNIRHPATTKLQNWQDLASYRQYLQNMPDESSRLPDLVVFLHQLESSRGNSILSYLPQYEQLLRSAGY